MACGIIFIILPLKIPLFGNLAIFLNTDQTYTPVLPGSILKAALNERKLSQKEFAKAVGVQPSHVSEIIKGTRRMTPAFAHAVAEVLGLSAENLISLQLAVDVHRRSLSSDVSESIQASAIVDELNKIVNVEALLKGHGLKKPSAQQKLLCLRHKYGITSIDGLRESFSRLAMSCFRRSAKTGLDERMIATWVVKAQSEALKHKPKGSFTMSSCSAVCDAIVAMLHKNSGSDNIQECLSTFGIGFCEVSKMDHASIDGYSFMKDDVPYIVTTGRYDRIDNMAFTIMHELGHIFLGHTNNQTPQINVDIRSFYDDDEFPQELAADAFAAERLIDKSVWKLAPPVTILNPWVIQRKYSEWALKRQLNPWIVLGRLSHETGIYKFKSDASRHINIQKGGMPMV